MIRVRNKFERFNGNRLDTIIRRSIRKKITDIKKRKEYFKDFKNSLEHKTRNYNKEYFKDYYYNEKGNLFILEDNDRRHFYLNKKITHERIKGSEKKNHKWIKIYR